MLPKGLFLRIAPDLDQRLSRYCAEHSYKKGGFITKLIRDFLDSESGERNAIDEAKEFGIDISLNASRLRKSPTERLRDHEAANRFAEEIRRSGERARQHQ